MLALYIGMLLGQLYSLYVLLDVVKAHEGSEVIFDNLWILFVVQIMTVLPVLVAYAIGRHFSGQQSRPWWAFLLFGGLLAWLPVKINVVMIDTRWSIEGDTPLLFLLPVVLAFLLAYLPVGRAPEQRRQRPFECPHCGDNPANPFKAAKKVQGKIFKCQRCQGHIKRFIDGKRLAIWFVPLAFLLVDIGQSLPWSLPIASWVILFTGMHCLLSVRQQPVEPEVASSPEQVPAAE